MYNELRKGMQQNLSLRYATEKMSRTWRHAGGRNWSTQSDPTRADEGNRTPNLLITNQLLCQLSYVSQCAEKDKLLVGRASAPPTFEVLSASMLHPLINSAGFCAPRSHASMKGACM